MRLLADENIPGRAVKRLRAEGHDVLWVSEEAPSIQDREILAWAQSEQRAIVTLDKDFGDLVFAAGQPASSGILLLRLEGTPEDLASAVLQVLELEIEIHSSFIVIEADRIRIRDLPDSLASS